jgi:hypothetical protein
VRSLIWFLPHLFSDEFVGGGGCQRPTMTMTMTKRVNKVHRLHLLHPRDPYPSAQRMFLVSYIGNIYACSLFVVPARKRSSWKLPLMIAKRMKTEKARPHLLPENRRKGKPHCGASCIKLTMVTVVQQRNQSRRLSLMMTLTTCWRRMSPRILSWIQKRRTMTKTRLIASLLRMKSLKCR